MSYKKFEVIKCPFCGREYLPCEIYLPDYFLGKPKSIYRDGDDKIEGILGYGMNLKEEYICDSCNTPFRVTARVQFFVDELEDKNTTKDYKTPLKKTSLFLKED